MSCLFSPPIKSSATTYIRACIVALAVLTITGITLLMWLLKKTRQTNTISFQFIIMMSISDLILSTSNLIALIMSNVSDDANTKICWIVLFFQFVIATCASFSVTMATFIALDRYLHMRYLEQYPSIFTKKRAYFLTIMTILLLVMLNAIFAMPFSNDVQQVFQAVYLFLAAPTVFAILMLCYHTMKTIRKTASQLTRSLVNQTRTLSKVLKAMAICTISLLIPSIIIKVLQMVNKNYKFSSSFLVDTKLILSYITFSYIEFSGSFGFLFLKLVLKRIARCFVCCRRGPIESTAENVL